MCEKHIISNEHVHDFDEYMVIVQREYILVFRDGEVKLQRGDEYHIQKGIYHAGRVSSGTRSIHCFGGARV
jgi:uncharacterized cupin superfamily protein